MIWEAKEREAELRGEERGKQKVKHEVATSMLLESLPPEFIAEITDLPLSEVQSLRSKLQK